MTFNYQNCIFFSFYHQVCWSGLNLTFDKKIKEFQFFLHCFHLSRVFFLGLGEECMLRMVYLFSRRTEKYVVVVAWFPT